MIPENRKPMSLDGRLPFWDRAREFLVFLATVLAVLAGAEVVMLLRGGDVEAKLGEPAATGEGAAVRSAEEATLADQQADLDVKPTRREAKAAAGTGHQKDQ